MKTIDGWETKRFDELGTIFSGSTPSTSIRSFWDGEIVWVTPYDLSRLNTPYLSDASKRITEKGLTGCSTHLLPAGSVVMSSRAPIGYIAIPTVPFCTNQGCKSIKLKSAFHSEFAYYNILFNIDKIKALGEGTTFAEISKTALSTVELSFPTSLPEQAKIAEILSTVDRAIEQTEALIAKQQRIKTGLMQDLLTRGIDEHGKLRSEQTHQFKDSPLGRIPVEWEVKPCVALCKQIVVGIVIRPVQYYQLDGVPVLRSANVKENRIDPSNLVFMSEKDNETLLKSQLFTGDLVTVRTGYPGTTAVVPSEFHGSNCVDVVISRPDPGIIRSDFLSIWINSDHGKRQVLEGQGGLAQQHFNVGEMKSLLVKVPSLQEQQRIEELLIQQSVTNTGSIKSLGKLRSLKIALMQDLLTGKKRVMPLLTPEPTH
jgi:type I restriction enzyme S subunit